MQTRMIQHAATSNLSNSLTDNSRSGKLSTEDSGRVNFNPSNRKKGDIMGKLKSLAVVMMLASSLALAMISYCSDAKKAPPPTDKQLIASAMSAAPAKVAKGATIVVMEADGKMRTLRQGTNGFTCMPDNPATPGPDPMCMDKNSMEWVNAWVAHHPPPAGKVGFMYMLAGGTDASNTDP